MKRPVSVLVFGIINIIFGVFGVLGFAGHLVVKLELIPIPGVKENPVMQLMAENPSYALYTEVLAILGFVAAILIIAASIGMFQLKPWARAVTIGWCTYSVLITILGAVVNHVMVMQPMLAEVDDGPVRVGILIGMVFALVFTVLFVGYYVLVMAMLSRAKVRDAFDGIGESLEAAA